MEVCWENNRTKRVVLQQAMFDQRVVWSVQTRIDKASVSQEKRMPEASNYSSCKFCHPILEVISSGNYGDGNQKKCGFSQELRNNPVKSSIVFQVRFQRTIGQ